MFHGIRIGSLGLPGYGGGGAPTPEADVIRVRRSSDSTEADYNLTEWDDGTLDTFVGAGDGCLATWYDDSGNDNHVTQSTTTLQPKVAISGVVQEGVVFDGINDYLTFGARATSGSMPSLSVAAFVKTTSAGNVVIASERLSSGSQNSWAMLSIASAPGKLVVWLYENGSTLSKDYRSSISINDGNWHHVAFTFGDGVLKLYIDGVEDTSVSKNADSAIATVFNSTAHFNVGAMNNGGAYYFAGSISDLQVEQSTLTAGNIATLAAGGEVGSPLIWLKGNYTP